MKTAMVAHFTTPLYAAHTIYITTTMRSIPLLTIFRFKMSFQTKIETIFFVKNGMSSGSDRMRPFGVQFFLVCLSSYSNAINVANSRSWAAAYELPYALTTSWTRPQEFSTSRKSSTEMASSMRSAPTSPRLPGWTLPARTHRRCGSPWRAPPTNTVTPWICWTCAKELWAAPKMKSRRGGVWTSARTTRCFSLTTPYATAVTTASQSSDIGAWKARLTEEHGGRWRSTRTIAGSRGLTRSIRALGVSTAR